jgi:hypothetical protein
MEKIMSKTNDTPKLGHGMLEDIELDAVTGGTKAQGSWFVALATALGKTANQAANAQSR